MESVFIGFAVGFAIAVVLVVVIIIGAIKKGIDDKKNTR